MSKRNVYKTDFLKNINYNDKEFRKILDFYLFKCPVEGTSKRGKTFCELGWTGSSSFSKLKKNMLSVEGSNVSTNYYPCIKTELEQKLNECDLLLPPNEYCVFLKYDEKTVMQSLYKAIRNALAHGSFNVNRYNKERIYYFENFDGYMKARMALKEETLIGWINIVTKN